ncbi:MAG: ribonuclease E/G [Lachnospiraceae bacterium]|nr:ribonuclease E/G [Lachnospiraceae bacterium]
MAEMEKGKILILEFQNKLLTMLIRHNRIVEIRAESVEEEACKIGNIYVGKIQNVSANIGAAFVEIQKGVMTFLPLSEVKNAVLTNRKPDGTLKAGDELLVQLVREPLKTKQAGVSTTLSLAGSYAVIEYHKSASGGARREEGVRVSSKMSKKYRHIYKELEPLQEIAKHFSMVIRTNADGLEDVSVVTAEAQSLADRMAHILEIGDKRLCFSCLHRGEPEYLSFVKNCYQFEYDEIVTDRKEIYETLLADGRFSPDDIRYYEDSMLPLYKLYSIETKISELLSRRVWLKSGAYLVIEQTEALVAIDVNTGKYEAGKKKEETYLKINLEAAKAIADALRARNLSGMILVDFINMQKKEHDARLMEAMKTFLAKDSVPAYVVDITGLGLMEITRKKKNKSFAEQMSE